MGKTWNNVRVAKAVLTLMMNKRNARAKAKAKEGKAKRVKAEKALVLLVVLPLLEVVQRRPKEPVQLPYAISSQKDHVAMVTNAK